MNKDCQIDKGATPPQLVVLTGGGTGGHFFPAKAMIEALMARGIECLYVGCTDGIEQSLAKTLPCESLLVPGLKRNTLKQKLCLPLNLFIAWRRLGVLWRKRKIGALIATGGYVSLMPCWTARAKKTPIVLLEQNCIPGKVLRHFSPVAAFIAWAFPPVEKPTPIKNDELIGNPIVSVLREKAEQCREAKSRRAKTLLIMGGSQSALSLDKLMMRLAKQGALAGLKIVHIATKISLDELVAVYTACGIEAEVLSFCNDMASIFSRVNMAICRAGASTATELALFGVPAIFIPYPYAADDHQRANAQYFVDGKAGYLVTQRDDENGQIEMDEQVTTILAGWQSDQVSFQRMSDAMEGLARPHAAEYIVDQVEKILNVDIA